MTTIKLKIESDTANIEETQYPLLTTKLYVPPPRLNLVSRSRLTERLDKVIGHKLTLISAPAGFGKTTLLSEWIHKSALPVAWISLDKGDSDPVLFIHYMIAALQTIESSIGKAALSALQSPQPPPVESVLTNLINEITSIPEDFALILDDYHLVEAKQIHSMVEFLLDHLPQQMHLVIATRSDPPLSLARLRGRNQLTEFRASDLCFTAKETNVFFNKAMKLGLSSDDIDMLESRTEGWIAGLQLAALSIQGRKDIPSFIKAFTGDDRHIMDYLTEEVFNRQSESVQLFLLQTSILDRLTGSLCDAVTRQDNGRKTLDELEKANLFIVPLDNKRLWYRYHHLFADLLRTRLHHVQPGQLHELHHRACQWYSDNGLLGEAIAHALAAADFERVADLVKQAAQTMIARGEFRTLLGWLKALPDEIVRTRPQLCLAHAWTLFINDQFKEAESRLQDVEVICNVKDSRYEKLQLEAFLGEVATIQAFIAHVQEDNPRAIKLSEQALERLPKDNLYLRSLITTNLGMAHQFSGDVLAARQAYSEARTIGQKTDHVLTTLLSINGLAELEVIQSHLYQAARFFQQSLQLAAQHTDHGGLGLPIAGTAHIGMGKLQYEWNDLQSAAISLLEGINLAKQFGLPVVLTVGYVSLARVKLAQGDVDGAYDVFRQAEQVAQKSHSIEISANVGAFQTKLWLSTKRGNLAAAAHWVEEYRLADELEYLREAEYLALARVLITLDQADEALQLLARLQEAAETTDRMGDVIEILLLYALALEAQEDTTQAITAIERALSLAEPGGYIRIFVDEGPPMAEVLQKVLDAKVDVPRAYVKKLLSAFRLSKLLETDEGLVEPLSDRELEVLRLIAAGLSNSNIAKELFISLNTVRTHTKNINSKLNVHSRIEAIAKAKEIGFL